MHGTKNHVAAGAWSNPYRRHMVVQKTLILFLS